MEYWGQVKKKEKPKLNRKREKKEREKKESPPNLSFSCLALHGDLGSPFMSHYLVVSGNEERELFC